MRRALYAVLLTGLFLLMLSALVVTPDEAGAQPPMREPADFQAMFKPLVSAILPDMAHGVTRGTEWRPILSVLPVLLLGLAFFEGVRDANGHVLTADRYENSVYQVFRPEIAGG